MEDLSGQMMDLSGCVEATKDRQRKVEESLASLNTSNPARRRAIPWWSLDLDQDIAEEVCRHVAKRMRQLPAYSGATTKEDSTSEEEGQPAPRRRKQIKSSMDWTGSTTMVNKVTWPHKVIYTSAGELASDQDISIPKFVHGDLILMEGEEMTIKERIASHLQELMSDAELYGWECTRAFHSILLNQLKQGRCTWVYDDEKL